MTMCTCFQQTRSCIWIRWFQGLIFDGKSNAFDSEYGLKFWLEYPNVGVVKKIFTYRNHLFEEEIEYRAV